MSPAWRPLPPDGPREPRPVADALGAVTARLGGARPATLGVVFARWAEAVGPSLAAHVTPRSLIDGVLVVSVDEPAWATHVRYLTPTILARLSDLAGPDQVTVLEVRVRR